MVKSICDESQAVSKIEEERVHKRAIIKDI